MVKITAVALMASTLIGILLTGAPVERELEQPIALDALPSVGIIVLGNRGTVYQLEGAGGKYKISKSFRIPVNQYPVDLTLAQINGAFYIFVTSNMPSTLRGRGLVTQYALDGHMVNYWDVWGVCTGIDFDGRTHTVYFAKSDDNELVSIQFDSKGKSVVSSLGNVAQATQIGPLALDAEGGKIYAGDIAAGGVYVFDLATRRSKRLATSLGNVTALRMIPAKRQLLVADAQRRQIVVLDTTGKMAPTVLSINARLRAPSGVANVDADLLALSDSDLGHILFVTDKGQVVGQF